MSNVEKNPKKKAKRKAKRAASPPAAKNGASVPVADSAVKQLGSDDALTVQAANKNLAEAQQGLGALREQYKAQEAAQLKELVKSRQSFDGVIRTLAQKHGVDLTTGQWVLNLSDMTFRRAQQG